MQLGIKVPRPKIVSVCVSCASIKARRHTGTVHSEENMITVTLILLCAAYGEFLVDPDAHDGQFL